MQELRWVDRLPGGTPDGGVDVANRLYWNLTVEQHQSRWFVATGEDTIFVADSREGVDAFLYGLGLAYSVLPEPVFRQLEQTVKAWVE